HEWPDGAECRVRMGVHTGEPRIHEEGYHGIGLSRGARIAHLAHGGQILVSTSTAELLHDDLPAGMTLRDLGERKLKDIDRPERISELVAEGLPPPRDRGSPRRRALAVVAAAVAVLATAAVSVVLVTSGGSSPQAAAAAVSANAVGIFPPAT